jgi:hypothetical protein
MLPRGHMYHMYSRLGCSPYYWHGIVSRSKLRAAKPRRGMNGLCSSAVILARRQWIVASMYDLSSPMYCRILELSNPMLYMCFAWSILQASLLVHLWVSAYSSVGHVPFYVKRVGQCFVLCLLGVLEFHSVFLEVWCMVAYDVLTPWCRVGEPQV